MSSQIAFIVELEIEADRQDDLRSAMKEMVASAVEEAGTLDYEWSVSADGTRCHILERYADSPAVLAHFARLAEKFPTRLAGIVKPVRCVVYGSPSDAVRQAMGRLDPVFMQPLGGFSK